MLNNSFPTSKKITHLHYRRSERLMQFIEITTVYSYNYMKLKFSLRSNAELLNVRARGAYSHHCALKKLNGT